MRGITLTRVQMDDDLRHGRVYFSHLEGKPRAAAALAGFKSANGFIKREIGRALNLRRTPDLEFEFDPGIEHAARIGALLRENAPKESATESSTGYSQTSPGAPFRVCARTQDDKCQALGKIARRQIDENIYDVFGIRVELRQSFTSKATTTHQGNVSPSACYHQGRWWFLTTENASPAASALGPRVQLADTRDHLGGPRQCGFRGRRGLLLPSRPPNCASISACTISATSRVTNCTPLSAASSASERECLRAIRLARSFGRRETTQSSNRERTARCLRTSFCSAAMKGRDDGDSFRMERRPRASEITSSSPSLTPRASTVGRARMTPSELPTLRTLVVTISGYYNNGYNR